MREADVARLRLGEMFPEGSDPRAETELRLGLSLPNSHALEGAIHDDLAQHQPYGVGWWLPNSEQLRACRILVADALYATVASIPHHLTAAQIHRLEYMASAEHDAGVFAETVLRQRHPQVARDVLAAVQARAAIDSLITALASALDCLAGAIVGVVPLRVNIKTASFRRVRSIAEGVGQLELDGMIQHCGPQGWVDWMLEYRNMVIHRGRRIEMHNPALETEIVAPDGVPAKWSTNLHLPHHPGLTEVEAFRVTSSVHSLLLAEKAEVTLEGLVSSTNRLVELVAERLLSVWRDRRSDPRASPQPLSSQWKKPSDRAEWAWSDFGGYDPGSDQLDPSAVRFNPKLVKRLLAAALMDHQESVWSRPEMIGYAPRER